MPRKKNMFVDLVPISKIDVENILSNFSSGFFIVINFPKLEHRVIAQQNIFCFYQHITAYKNRYFNLKHNYVFTNI